ncbi:MAG: histidine ammonia-lyase [Chloroflexota bacterium]|jgi:histidine ammonia-lyase
MDIVANGENLTIEQVVQAARKQTPVRLELPPRFYASRELVAAKAAGPEPVYGINTGFGLLATIRISEDQLQELQRNLVMSHAAGVGDPVPTEVCRAILLLRLNTLAKGFSGVREETVRLLVEMLNRRVHPIIPSRGSVGASGDLASLAHLALVMIGLGEAEFQGDRLPGADALAKSGLTPLALEAKEGLALINGTQLMAAYGALAIHDAERLVEAAEIACALSIEAFKGSMRPADPRIQSVRPHPGQVASAAHLHALLEGSSIVDSHQNDCPRVQDPYSLRCAPQVFGAVREGLTFARSIIERELNSATDNPLCFGESETILSGGNFHGQPVALALDVAKMVLTQMGNFSDRRSYRLLSSAFSGLPPFLARKPGLNSGYMVAQYTSAALCAENGVLGVPATLHSIPTSAGMEDFNSMGATSAVQLRSIVENVQRIVAVELLCAAQGVEEHRPLRSTDPLEAAVAAIRQRVPTLDRDRPLSEDIERVAKLIREGILQDEVQKAFQ